MNFEKLTLILFSSFVEQFKEQNFIYGKIW